MDELVTMRAGPENVAASGGGLLISAFRSLIVLFTMSRAPASSSCRWTKACTNHSTQSWQSMLSSCPDGQSLASADRM